MNELIKQIEACSSLNQLEKFAAFAVSLPYKDQAVVWKVMEKMAIKLRYK